MRMSSFVICGLIAIVFIIQSFSVEKSKTPLEKSQFENLKVLPDNISKEDLEAVMKTVANSLDVKCSYCHAKDESTGKLDYASDIKIEKQIARGMMRMAIDLNKKYFLPHSPGDTSNILAKYDSDVKYMFSHVTCYTCHHGNAHPISTPPAQKWSNK